MRKNSVGTSGKKKRIVNIVLILLVIVCFAVWAIDYFKMPNEDLTLEQRVISVLDGSEMDSANAVENVCLLEKIDDGYMCVAVNKSGKLIFAYFVEDSFSDCGLAMKARLVTAAESYVNNTNPIKTFSFTMSNLDKRSIYFGCYQSDAVADINVDGKGVKQYKATVNIGGMDYELNFWFVISEKAPLLSDN
ncbi:MAG: hypothetical protein PUF31_08350 [Oscillospiraceae bacterium]|nr:hypothetical protein [Oscillospiraceae bacterium]